MSETQKLFSSFALDSELVSSLKKRGIMHPTPVQEHVLKHLSNKKDIYAVSSTGSGKTLAYTLPILNALLKDDMFFYALIILPTRELSLQVHSVISDLGSEIGLRTSLLIGGVDLLAQGKSLASRPHFIIGTPGRILHHLKNTRGVNCKSFKYLVLDECDRILDGDFDGDVSEICKLISPAYTFLFTATASKRVRAFVSKSMDSPIFFGGEEAEVPSSVFQQYVYLPQKHKEAYLLSILQGTGDRMGIIFVSTCIAAERIGRILKSLGIKAESIHGNQGQPIREETINKFRAGIYKWLVGTDVAARGVDITDIRIVINYDMPNGVREYVHRVGRTGRGGSTGSSITFVSQYDVDDFRRLEIKLGKKIEEYTVSSERIYELLDEIDSAKRTANAEMKENGIGEKVKEMRRRRKGEKTRKTKRDRRR